MAATESEPLEHLKGAGPTGTSDGPDDEGEIGGSHLDATAVKHVGDVGRGGQSEDPVGKELDTLAPVTGALESELSHLLRARAALLAVERLERIRLGVLGRIGIGGGLLG